MWMTSWVDGMRFSQGPSRADELPMETGDQDGSPVQSNSAKHNLNTQDQSITALIDTAV
jgi:hypothetical protein